MKHETQEYSPLDECNLAMDIKADIKHFADNPSDVTEQGKADLIKKMELLSLFLID